MNEVWVGVDVSKQRLDVAVRPGDESWSQQNSQAGIKTLTRRLKKLSPQRIVLSSLLFCSFRLIFTKSEEEP
jgi:transposase